MHLCIISASADGRSPGSAPSKKEKPVREEGKVVAAITVRSVMRLIRFQLMVAEWMDAVPEDFTTWLATPCPVGQRALLVASQVP